MAKYNPTDGINSPYVASLLENLKHWLEDGPEITKLVGKIPILNREKVFRNGQGTGLALLLTGSALSLPNMLVIGSVMGIKRSAAFR